MRSARAASSPTVPPFDPRAFARDLAELRAELDAGLGESDLRHFRKMLRWGRTCSVLGWGTAWIAPNPVSATLIALGTSARWAIAMHHVSHRGLDRVPGSPWSSKTFAKGRRRFVDWLEWMTPEAWNLEHNVLHHYRTGEIEDPDLVEHHLRPLRESKLPDWVKLGVVGFWACTWKLLYYAPNTWSAWRANERERGSRRGETDLPYAPTKNAECFDPRTETGRAFYATILPYALARFVAAPAAFLPLGPWASANVLANALMAEVIGNVHTFAIIAPNHAGDDMWRFDAPMQDKSEFFVRQVLGSVNFSSPNELTDFLQGFLNYQIEHHLWPDLPPSKYREAAPKVRAICEKHGVPYVEEPLWKRVKQLVGIMIGTRTMRRANDARAAMQGDEPALAAE
jgi:fatty acid desaturase